MYGSVVDAQRDSASYGRRLFQRKVNKRLPHLSCLDQKHCSPPQETRSTPTERWHPGLLHRPLSICKASNARPATRSNALAPGGRLPLLWQMCKYHLVRGAEKNCFETRFSKMCFRKFGPYGPVLKIYFERHYCPVYSNTAFNSSTREKRI